MVSWVAADFAALDIVDVDGLGNMVYRVEMVEWPNSTLRIGQDSRSISRLNGCSERSEWRRYSQCGT